MENHEDFHHDDLLDRAVNAVLSDPVPDDLSPDRVARLAAVVRQAAERPYSITIIQRIKNMRPRTRIAVAATVLVAILGLLSWLVPGSVVSVAFADVAEALTNVRSATWKSTMTVITDHKTTCATSTIEMYLAPSHDRTETMSLKTGSKTIEIEDGEKNKAIRLDPVKKTALVIDEYYDLKKHPSENDLGRGFQRLQKLVADAKDGKLGKVDRLGAKTIDGHPAEGFHFIQDRRVEITIWADSKTLLPVRVEKRLLIIDKSTNATGDSNKDLSEVRIVMSDFQVDVKLDKSLFSLDVPDGYTVVTPKEQGFGGLVESAPPKKKQGELQKEPPKTPELEGRLREEKPKTPEPEGHLRIEP